MSYRPIKKLKKAFQITTLTLISLLIFSCGSKYDGRSEGEIHFKVTYPKLDHDNFMLDFLPKKMIVKFKNDRVANTLSAGMGMFRLGMVSDIKNQHLVRTAKLINKKYALNLKGESIFDALKKEAEYNIQFTEETKTILGFECKKINISIANGSNGTFAAYYTDEIDIKDPNWFNQYAPIKGVLLEYEYEKYDMIMRFTATKIHFKELKDSDFDVPKEYIEITEQKMNEEMIELFSSFK